MTQTGTHSHRDYIVLKSSSDIELHAFYYLRSEKLVNRTPLQALSNSNKNIIMSSFKSSGDSQKKEGDQVGICCISDENSVFRISDLV